LLACLPACLLACLLGRDAADQLLVLRMIAGYVSALAACLLGGDTVEQNCTVHALECASSRLEGARANLRALREHLAGPLAPDVKVGRSMGCVCMCVCD
jgi:hypothetical protein